MEFVWIIYRVYYKQIDLANFGVVELINGTFNTTIISIYWYFIPLSAMYLLIPFLANIPKENREQAFRYAISCLLIFDIVLPFMFGAFKLNYNNALRIGTGYVIYILMGYYIDNYEIQKKVRVIIYFLGIAGLITHIVGTRVLSYAAGSIVQTYKGYLNLPCVLYSVAIFILFKYCSKTKIMHVVYLFAAKLQSMTFGIYLVHIYVLWQISEQFHYDLVYRIPVGVLTFIISALIVYVLQKIPVINRIVPK